MNKITIMAIALTLSLASAGKAATDMVDAAGIKGGFVVQVGCGDPGALVDLRANDSYIVQGLDTDPVIVAKARKHIKAKGLYGKVSVQVFDGKSLPYVDSLVNLIVVRGAGRKVSAKEIPSVASPVRSMNPARPSTVGQWVLR